MITPGKNLWHCLGACGTGGSVIDWMMRAEGVSFRHAVELLRKDHLPSAAGPVAAVKQSTVRKLPAPVTAETGDGELLGTIVGFYQDALRESPEAMKLLIPLLRKQHGKIHESRPIWVVLRRSSESADSQSVLLCRQQSASLHRP